MPAPRRRAAGALGTVAVAGLALVGSPACGSGPGGSTGAATSAAPTTQEQLGGADSTPGATKKVFKPDHPDVAVLAGEKFALRLPEDPAAGGGWKVVSAPDERLVESEGDTFKAEVPAAGAPAPTAGQREHKFKARRPGTTTITFGGCADCGAGSGGPERITFTITIS